MDQLKLGDDLRDSGMALATSNTDGQIVQAVDIAIGVCLSRYPMFTSDHVRDQVEVGMGYAGADIGKVIGARMNAAGRRGDIITTGMTTKSSRPDAHSRRLLVWRRAS